MFKQRLAALTAVLGVLIATTIALVDSTACAQTSARSATFQVSGPAQRLRMTVNTSRILKLKHRIPRLLVDDPSVLTANPISPNEVQVSARRAGVTQLNVWDEHDNLHTVDVIVMNDVRELDMILKSEFPDSAIRITPLTNQVMLSGYVPTPEDVGHIEAIARTFSPEVINNLTVGGGQQIMLRVKVMEVSRTKARALGIDWDLMSGSSLALQRAGGVLAAGTETLRLGFVNGNDTFTAYIDALKRNGAAKVLAEPNVVTVNGRAASFHSGGEFAYDVSQGLGAVSTQFREFGTRVDFVPIIIGNGALRLEVRPLVTELDTSLASNSGVPGMRTRWVDTAVEMKAGQTLAIAGLIQTRTESENRGLPILSDLPWVGALFRTVKERVDEVELVVLVTPEFVEAVDVHEMPKCGPGETTGSPSDAELYIRGYNEVPRCCNDRSCASCQSKAARGGLYLESVKEYHPRGQIVPSPSASKKEKSARVKSYEPQLPVYEPQDPRQTEGVLLESYAPSGVPIQNPYQTEGSTPPVPQGELQDEAPDPGFLGPIGYDEL